MKKLITPFLLLVLGTSGMTVQAQDVVKAKDSVAAKTAKDSTAKPPAPKTITDKIKSSKKIDGLFTLYQDTATGSIQLFVKKEQLGKEFIYQSFSLGGPTSLFLNQNMIRTTFPFTVQKIFDKIQFAQPNTNLYYDPTNPVSKAANVDAQAAIFYSDKIVAEDSTGYLIAADGLFISEKLDQIKPTVSPMAPPGSVFSLGMLNTTKSSYEEVRSFPKNTDVVVKLVYDNGNPINTGGVDITDARYNTVRFQHSFIAMPENDDFRPRRDDPRVGYFGAKVDDVTSLKAAPYKDFISRWKLVKKNPNAAVSEPVEPIVFWIENTTPYEYREIIKKAGEKWNEAFEQAGFKNAVVMKIMPDTATWDPADIRYNVIRWVSSAYPSYGAIGPSFFNPRTGQILGADITVEWKSGAGVSIQNELYNGFQGAAKMPWETSEAEEKAHFSFGKNSLSGCTLAQEMQSQYQSAMVAIELLDEKDKAGALSELHQEFLTYLIMHEMGHTLGLNHNMKASQMLSPSEVHDKKITRKLGLIGSVMDYPSVNVSLDRSKQGDYYTTKAGPYDLWAIEYGYTPFPASSEEAGLQKILNRSSDPKLAFGNDADDMRSPGNGIDPRVMVNDLTNDMPAYAEERFKLVNNLIPKLKDKYLKPDESYQLLFSRFYTLQSQRVQMALSLSKFIGGIYVDRSYPNQKSNNTPYTPVPVAIQKKALSVLDQYIFAPDAFKVDAPLYPYLQRQRRGFDFFGSPEDIKPQTIYQSIHRGVLSQFLHPTTLQRLISSSLYGNTYSVTDFMNDMTQSFFNADLGSSVNVYRQDLQTTYVEGLAAMINGVSATRYDNPSKTAAYATLKKLKSLLTANPGADEQTRAHRDNLLFIIEKAITVK
ncbi:MAG: zinc-dependent metalloprotease [Niabella sp.]